MQEYTNKTALISPEYVKKTTIIDSNVDDSLLTSIIIMCQNVYMVQTLGESLLEYLCMAGANNSLTSPYIELVNNYIRPCLAASVVVEYCISGTYKERASGLVQDEGNHYSHVDRKDTSFLESHYKYVENFYYERLKKHLMHNRSLYPELKECECEYLSADLKTNYDCGLNLRCIK